jgi:hypothetical protein
MSNKPKSCAMWFLVIGTLCLVAVPVASASRVPPPAAVPPPECTTHINYDRNADLPGYWVTDPQGTACVPFIQTEQQPPAGYEGNFYVDEFSDAAIKAKWEVCKQDPACRDQIRAIAATFVPVQIRVTGTVDPFGRIDPEGDVDLADIRRPAYFGQDPYYENIAQLENRTYTFEYTVPRDAYERLHLGLSDPIKLRGWFIQGEGIPGAKGKRTHAVAVLVGGRSIETTATQGPDDPLYTCDANGNNCVGITYPQPGKLTEKWGVRQWRQYIYTLNQAGFDIFTMDKRGHGISGGRNSSDTGEQAEDIFRGLDALETGDGLRLLTPSGELLSGPQAAGILLRGLKAKQVPVIIGGPSQGALVTGFAMQKNFDRFCAYNLPNTPCTGPYHYNVKGALMLAPSAGGPGFMSSFFALLEGELRTEQNVQLLPSSEVLSSIPKWPAVFFGKGTWDYLESMQGTLTAYQAAKGLKEIVVVRGPHSENEYGPENVQYMQEHVAAFALAAALNVKELDVPEPSDVRELIRTSPPFWEPSSVPTYP